MLLTAFEGISPAAYEAALHHVPRLRRPFPAAAGHAYFLLVELAAGAAFDAGLLEEALGGAIAPFMDSDDGAIANVAVDHRGRSEGRRVGKESVSTCRSRWWPLY